MERDMGYAKIENGKVTAIFDEQAEELIPFAGVVQVGWNFANSTFYPNPPAPPVPPSAWEAYQIQALGLLGESDLVALRCFKEGVTFPEEWRGYVLALRAIVRAASGDASLPLPARPDFPAGT